MFDNKFDNKKETTKMKEFQKNLEQLINSHSIENVCDIPDFLLAEMIVNFIRSVGPVMKKTLDWHGCDSVCHPSGTPANIVEGPGLGGRHDA